MASTWRGIVVSPDPGLTGQVRDARAREGARVESTTNAEEALGMVVAEGAHLVIAEGELAGNSGYQLCADLKSLQEMPRVLLVFVGSDPRAPRRAAECGADAVLRRPFTAAQLIEKVRSIVEPEFFTAFNASRQGPSALSIVEPASGIFGAASEWAESVVSQVVELHAGSTQELPAMAIQTFDENHPVSVPVDPDNTAHFDADSSFSARDIEEIVDERLAEFAAPGGPLSAAIQATVHGAVADALRSVLPSIASEAARLAREGD